jgi:hypothetical protein
MARDMTTSAAEMLEEAGAKNVRLLEAPLAPGLAIHEMGTARMGEDATAWPVPRRCQLVRGRWGHHAHIAVSESVAHIHGLGQPGCMSRGLSVASGCVEPQKGAGAAMARVMECRFRLLPKRGRAGGADVQLVPRTEHTSR